MIDRVFGVGVIGLVTALIVPCVPHLIGQSGTNKRFYGNPTICNKGYMEYAAILFY
jgi:hypothetical protein